MAKYTVKRSNQHIFFFKHESDTLELLHIYVRHLTTEQDAIIAFFSGTTTWNKTRKRFETTNTKHTVYWFWMDEAQKKVMIVTCFSV